MNNRAFNTIMPSVNEQWAARVLGMTWNVGSGPDLIDEDKLVELKFLNINCLKRIRYSGSWTVFDYQLDYDPEKKRYWGLGTYLLDKPVSSIRTKNKKRLEAHVLERELSIVDWEWMQQFEPHKVQGTTRKSAWKHTFRYAKRAKLPKPVSTYPVEKGRIHLTAGIDPKDFAVLTGAR